MRYPLPKKPGRKAKTMAEKICPKCGNDIDVAGRCVNCGYQVKKSKPKKKK